MTSVGDFNALGLADLQEVPGDELLRRWSRDDDLIEVVAGRATPTRIDPEVRALLSTTP